MDSIRVSTKHREQLVDITADVQRILSDNGWTDGLLCLYCTHTTAAVTINEAADPSVPRDILVNLGSLVPRQGDYKHLEGNSDAHIKSSMIGCSELVPVERGKMSLGTWQGIFFAEFDGPRSRQVLLKWLPGKG
jgi:secondary thiamine-phosphate synthase enzyme